MLIREPLPEPVFEPSSDGNQIEAGSDEETKQQLSEKTASSRVDVLKGEEDHRLLALLREESTTILVSRLSLRKKRFGISNSTQLPREGDL